MLINIVPDFTIFFIIFGVLIIVVAITAIFSYKKRNKLKKVLEKQAIKRNGVVNSVFGGLSYPYLIFSYNFNEFKIYSVPGGKNRPPFTYVHVTLVNSTIHHMRLYKEGFSSKIGKKLGMQDIEVGIDSFDNDIIIKGSDENFIRSLLIYKVQDKVLKIIRNHKASITLNQNRLVIFVQKVVYEDFVYDDLIDTAMAIIDQFKEIYSKF